MKELVWTSTSSSTSCEKGKGVKKNKIKGSLAWFKRCQQLEEAVSKSPREGFFSHCQAPVHLLLLLAGDAMHPLACP